MKKRSFLYKNGLSLTFILLFILALLAQTYFGWKQHNSELQEDGTSAISFYTYLYTGHFISATFENFQSEFLQMALYVILTIFLRQMGSAESKSLDEEEDVDREPKAHPNAPGPVKKEAGDSISIKTHYP